MITLDEQQKINYITDIITTAYYVEESVIIIDDIDIIINYIKFGNNVIFSNRIYQVLITLLKTEPMKNGHKLTLIVTCANTDLIDNISKYFDMIFEIGTISDDNIEKIESDLNIKINEINQTIKSLLNA